MCELTKKVDDETAQFLYMHGLKEAVRLQVNVARPQGVEDMIIIARPNSPWRQGGIGGNRGGHGGGRGQWVTQPV